MSLAQETAGKGITGFITGQNFSVNGRQHM